MIQILYATVPKEIIYNKEMNDKRVIVYCYFSLKCGLDDTVGFSCDSVVTWCSFKLNYHKDKINENITTTINSLISNQYIKVSGVISRNEYNEATLNMEKFCPDTQFAIIYYDEIQKIKDFKKIINDDKEKNRMSSAILLLILSYLRMNMLRRQEGYIGKESDKPEFCYRYYIDIEKDIGVSSRYISRAINILIKLDILAKQEIPRYKDEYDNWHTEVTLFVNKYKYDKQGRLDQKYNYQQELQWGIDYIKEKKYLKKKFKQDTENK